MEMIYMKYMETKFEKVSSSIWDWNTSYGDVKIFETPKNYLITFCTGGWSENETIAQRLYFISSIQDNGGYYLIELPKIDLSKEQIKILINVADKIIKKKKFIYKFIRD
jgi:hypothetical protein